MIYAVNKRTKEHWKIKHLSQKICFSGDYNWDIVQADFDGWVEWHGEAECPLPDGAIHDVKFRDGVKLDEYESPESWYWHHMGEDADIIAYRPILDAYTSPAPPAWDGSGMPRDGTLACTGGGECEVIATDATRGRVCVRWHDGELGVVPIGAVKPRPIRSEEDRVVEYMLSVIEDSESADDCCRAPYRAGYRRT